MNLSFFCSFAYLDLSSYWFCFLNYFSLSRSILFLSSYLLSLVFILRPVLQYLVLCFLLPLALYLSQFLRDTFNLFYPFSYFSVSFILCLFNISFSLLLCSISLFLSTASSLNINLLLRVHFVFAYCVFLPHISLLSLATYYFITFSPLFQFQRSRLFHIFFYFSLCKMHRTLSFSLFVLKPSN